MAAIDGVSLTAAQTKALEELRRRVSGELADGFKQFDETCLLYRFLKARDFDVTKAEIMLRKSLQWRRTYDPILRDYKPPEILKKYFSNFYLCSDKEGCPVFYIPGGKYDIRGLHMAAKYDDIEKSVQQIFEYHENIIEQESKEQCKRRLTRFVVIFNEAGLTLANVIDKAGVETIIRLGQVQQDNFPERLKAVYFINSPSFLTLLFNIAKNILSAETMRKIHVYGKEGWQEEILKVIDEAHLPVFMGGTRTDPDGNPLCKTFLNQGGKIDKSYYINKERNPLSKSPGVQKLCVSRSSSLKILLAVAEAGSVIEWEFEIRCGDIGFGLYFKDAEKVEESEMKEVVPLRRLNTKTFVESGMYKCEKSGHYIVLFDNTYSWLWSKELFYKVKVLKPSELEKQINE